MASSNRHIFRQDMARVGSCFFGFAGYLKLRDRRNDLFRYGGSRAYMGSEVQQMYSAWGENGSNGVNWALYGSPVYFSDGTNAYFTEFWYMEKVDSKIIQEIGGVTGMAVVRHRINKPKEVDEELFSGMFKN